ncbi:MAG: metal ABC transporter permease [Methanospirillaceae archaeon]|nr:metal ABC transporter permease [Methanospirillaceae archaeon]
MLEILEYSFFTNALLAGVLASVVCGIIGSYIVVRQMVSVSGGIAHASFGGVGMGYWLGIDPLLGAFCFSGIAALCTGWLMMYARQQFDSLIGVIWAGGMAIGVVFIAITPGFAPDLFTYLFGNILLVTRTYLIIMGLLLFVVIAIVVVLYHRLLAVSFDQEYSQSQGLAFMALNLLMLLLIVIAIVILIRVVGIILVIALLSIPASTARQYAGSLHQMMIYAILIGIFCSTVGIWLSYLWNIPSGATIILVALVVYLLSILQKTLVLRRYRDIMRYRNDS